MRKIKSLAAILLAVSILAAIATQAFAAEANADAAAAHTHQWYFDHFDTAYIPIDGEKHLKTVYPVYYCSVPGCSEVDLRSGSSSEQAHTMNNYSYTGSNYHSGSNHYARYERSCIQCGHTDGYWDSYRCPGNGHCILPQSVFPVLMEK